MPSFPDLPATLVSDNVKIYTVPSALITSATSYKNNLFFSKETRTSRGAIVEVINNKEIYKSNKKGFTP